MKRVLYLVVLVFYGPAVGSMVLANEQDRSDPGPAGVGRVPPGLYVEVNETGQQHPSLVVGVQEVTPNIVLLRGVNGWLAFASYDESRKEYRGFFEWKEFGAGRSPGGKWADLYQFRLVAQEDGQFHMTGKSRANDFIIRGKPRGEEKLVQLPAADEDARKELKALQGKWKAVAMEAAGRPLPRDTFPAFTWDIAEDGTSTAHMPTGDYPVAIAVDPGKNPRTFVTLNEKGEYKGTRQYGIYKLEGDRFTVCETPPGVTENDRPTDFTTRGSPNVVIVFERVKEDKKP
jgi:uncharacterized protein (TIGR03067 family)